MDNTTRINIAQFESMFISLAKNPRAYRPQLWRGPPGIGKTATFARIARTLGLTLAPLEFAHCAEEEGAGIPVRDEKTGQVVRLPLGPLLLAQQQPCLLFFDEVSRANEVKQGSLLTLVNERRAGDFRLHPQTVVALAANGTESNGAFKLIDALANRVAIIDAMPNNEEVCNYLRTLGDPQGDAYDVALHDAALDWAATSERTPNMIQIEPPPGQIENGEQYPSPRQCENVCATMAQLTIDKMPVRLLHAQVAGLVSGPVAMAYFAVRALRDHLPTVAEICRDPKTALLPATIEAAAAAMALVEQAAARNPEAGWVYAERFQQEDIRVALGKRMTGTVRADTKAARDARGALVSSQVKAVRAAGVS